MAIFFIIYLAVTFTIGVLSLALIYSGDNLAYEIGEIVFKVFGVMAILACFGLIWGTALHHIEMLS